MSFTLHKRILAIALPMIVSNLSVPLVGMVDTGVAGHLPDVAYLAAVAVGATIFNFLFLGLNFLRMGTTGLTAQAHGRDDFSAARGALAQAVLLALGLAAVLLILQWPLRELALLLVAPDDQVAVYVREYFDVRIWSAPLVLANYALIGWFLGMQTARAPLLMMLAINLVNAALDFIVVYGFGMGVDGIALASVCGEATGLMVGLFLAYRLLRAYPADWDAGQLRQLQRWRELIAVNGNILLRTLCLMLSFGLFTALGARLGAVVLAANALLLNLQSLMAYGLDGFAHAAEALAGRAWGQRAIAAFRAAVHGVLIWSLGIATVFALIYWLTGRNIINLLTDLPEVRAAAYTFLPWMILSPLISVWSFVYDGVFIGATWAREMRNAMLIATFGIFVPLAFWLVNVFGNHGLWFAFVAFLGARGLTMAGWYQWRMRQA
ncbi:MAG TPA: MATE family efflux transporter [Gammaproteobacteria bacterium]|nr:MATE family efflux transporter [Gammaproteobacteria bacterium]